jgi:hypothetical protein
LRHALLVTLWRLLVVIFEVRGFLLVLQPPTWISLPDNASAAAIALTIGSSGSVTIKTTVLMTPEEVDAATKKTPTYRSPGK